jgi:transcription initiation factor TFIID subunit 2
VDLADALEASYRKEWQKVMSPRLTVDEKKAMTALLARSLKEKSSLFFREPVDPVLHNIPQYFDM